MLMGWGEDLVSLAPRTIGHGDWGSGLHTQSLTEANTKSINVRNLLAGQMLKLWGPQKRRGLATPKVTPAACCKVQDPQITEVPTYISSMWPGCGLEMGWGAPGSSPSCREGKKRGLHPSLCLASCVIFRRTGDLCESVFSLKIKTMKTVTAPTSQRCYIK